MAFQEQDVILTAEQRGYIEGNRGNIIENLDPDVLLVNNLRSTGVLPPHKTEQLANLSTSTEKNEFLLNFLLKSPQRKMCRFLEVLEECHQSHVAHLFRCLGYEGDTSEREDSLSTDHSDDSSSSESDSDDQSNPFPCHLGRAANRLRQALPSNDPTPATSQTTQTQPDSAPPIVGHLNQDQNLNMVTEVVPYPGSPSENFPTPNVLQNVGRECDMYILHMVRKDLRSMTYTKSKRKKRKLRRSLKFLSSMRAQIVDMTTGSVIWRLRFECTAALDVTWTACQSGLLKAMLEEDYITKHFLRKFGLKGAAIDVKIVEEEYWTYRQSMIANIGESPVICSTPGGQTVAILPEAARPDTPSALPKREALGKALKTADPETVRRKLESLAVKGQLVSTTHVMPTRFSFVFEFGTSGEEMVTFIPYTGERQPYHRKRRCYEPALVLTPLPAEDLHQRESLMFLSELNKSLEMMVGSYNAKDHGRLRVVGRFGKFYYYNDPPAKFMTVDQLNTSTPKLRGKPFSESSALIPLDVPHAVLEQKLVQAGFQNISTERRFLVNTEFELGSQKFRFRIVLNEHMELVQVRLADQKWIVMNVKRFDTSRRDIRITLQSVRELDQSDHPAVRRYGSAKLLDVKHDALTIRDPFIREIKFVREKVTKKYKRPAAASALPNFFETEVHLMTTEDYGSPNPSGHFQEEKDWREEVVIQPEPPNIHDLQECQSFFKDFLQFSFEVEMIGHQMSTSK